MTMCEKCWHDDYCPEHEHICCNPDSKYACTDGKCVMCQSCEACISAVRIPTPVTQAVA